MIAKIGRGTNMMGALSYNWLKVSAGKGAVLSTHKIIETPGGNHSMSQFYRSFEPYLIANKRTEKPVLHISLNPDPSDKVNDDNFQKMARDYMKRMGYGEQPYVVFKHTDTSRTHIHIVTTCVDRRGKKIPDTYEKFRSMDACRDLEQKYGLTPATEKQRTAESPIFQPLDHNAGDLKSQIAAVVRHLPKYYQCSGLGTYNALLSLFNITAEEVKGELHGRPKQGLVYFALKEKGEKACTPFKSSLFGKQAGQPALQEHFLQAKETMKTSPTKDVLRNTVEAAMYMTGTEADFKKQLLDQGINTVVRRTNEGRIYGITFIDHESRSVWNGSQLDKSLSANAFNDRWQAQLAVHDNNKVETAASLIFPRSDNNASSEDPKDTHQLFDFLDEKQPELTDIALDLIEDFGSLLPESQGDDYEEQAFANRMKKKRRRH